MIGLMIDVTQQKNTELELVRSETAIRWRPRVQRRHLVLGFAHGCLHVSRRFHQIVGLGAGSDLVHDGGWRFLEQLIDPEDRARVQAAYSRHLAGKQPNFRWISARSTGGAAGVGQLARARRVRRRRCGAHGGVAQRSGERGSSYDALTNLPGRCSAIASRISSRCTRTRR